ALFPLEQQVWHGESRSATLLELARASDKVANAFAADELQRATGPGGEADAEDRTDVAVALAGQHTVLQATRRFDGLAIQDSIAPGLQVVLAAGLFEHALQLRPESLRPVGGVVVKPATCRASAALEFVDQPLDHRVSRRRFVRFAFGREIGARL